MTLLNKLKTITLLKDYYFVFFYILIYPFFLEFLLVISISYSILSDYIDKPNKFG